MASETPKSSFLRRRASWPTPAIAGPSCKRHARTTQHCAGASNGFWRTKPAADDFFADARIELPTPAAVIGQMTEKPGDRIGRYKLLEKIGEGGMGVVYMAQQEEPVRRRVALKIIKLGMDTKQVVARFEAERQALALMDHPNIAKVLDGGATDTGRPYFVMELVQGVPITEFCDQNRLPARGADQAFHHRLPGHPKRAPEGDHSPGPQAHQHPGHARRRGAHAHGD